MRKLKVIQIIAIAGMLATSSQLAFARKAGGDQSSSGKPFSNKEVTVKKTTDKASPNLFKYSATGSHYKEVTITTRSKSKGKVNNSDITIKKTTDKASP